MAKTTISASIDKALLAQLDDIAAETERSRSWLLSKALEVYFDELREAQVAKARLEEPTLTPKQLRKKLGL